MMDFFTPTANDQSLTYLSSVFGNMNGVLPSGGTITILGTMFQTFNSIALVIGTLIVAYITVVGIMMTAHEGEFMKKWNSLWTPLRAVLGIASLVPTTSGFSALQIVMMWVIVQGVGAADTLWNTALTYLTTFQSPYSQVSVNNPGAGIALNNLFEVAVCEASAYAQNAPPVTLTPQTGGYFCYNNGNAWCSNALPSLDASQSSMSFGPGGACGSMTYCNQATACQNNNSLACMACQAQIQVLGQQVLPLIRQIASYFVIADYQYQNYYNNGNAMAPNGQVEQSFPPPDWVTQYCQAQGIPTAECTGPMTNPLTGNKTTGQLPSPNSGNTDVPNSVVDNVYWPYAMEPQYAQGGNNNFINTISTQYSTAIQTAVSSYVTQQALSNPSGVSSAYASAQQPGWVYAGAYYYSIAQGGQTNLQGSWPTINVTVQTPSAATTANPNVLQNDRTNVQAAQELIGLATGAGSGPAGAATAPMSSASTAISQSLVSAIQPNSNALATFANAGYALLTSAEIIFIALLASVIFLGLVSGINVFALGTGGIDPMFAGIGPMWMLLIPLSLALMGVMVTMGGFMGIYVPLIPFTIFLFGVIGWFTSTIEAMVAGPLVALGILAPGGQHEILGKAEPALMLLFSIFLRPALMIFGLISAMLLANTVVVPMINALFWSVAVGQLASASGVSTATLEANVLESILLLVFYVMLIVTAVNKCFELIHIIPERVVTWIGGHGVSYGEGQALGEMKGAAQSGAATAKGGMEGATTKSAEHASAKKQVAANKAAREKAAGPEVKPTDSGPPKDK